MKYDIQLAGGPVFTYYNTAMSFSVENNFQPKLVIWLELFLVCISIIFIILQRSMTIPKTL